MRSREWYEDSIHSLIKACLPDVAPSNIRPAYQKTKQNNPMGVNHMDAFDPMKDGIDSAQNKTDIVYFWWHFDPLDLLSTSVETSEDGVTISSLIPFRLTISCYGKNSMPNAIRLKAYFRTPDLLNSMLQLNSVLNSEPTLTTFPEEINEEWWERTDLDLSFMTLVDDFTDDNGATPPAEITDDSKGYSTSTDGVVPVGAYCVDVEDVNEKKRR